MLQYSKNKFSRLSLCLAPFSPCAFNCLFFPCCIKCKLLPFIFQVHPSLFCSLSYFLGLRRGVPAFCWLSLHRLLIKVSNKWLCFLIPLPSCVEGAPHQYLQSYLIILLHKSFLKVFLCWDADKKSLVFSGAAKVLTLLFPWVSLSPGRRGFLILAGRECNENSSCLTPSPFW